MNTPIIIPLLNGNSEDSSTLDARRPGIFKAQDVDYRVNGELAGRPGFVSANSLSRRDSSGGGFVSSFFELDQFPTSSPYTGLFRYRDSNGERPALTATGRVWTWEGSYWTDRLFCASARVDRIAEFFRPSGTLSVNPAAAYNFGIGISSVVNGDILLGGTTPSINAYELATSAATFGNAAEFVSGSDVYHCAVGNGGVATTNLTLAVRKNNDPTIAYTVLAANCDASVAGLSISPCCASGNGVLYVLYKQTAANNYILLRVNPLTGATLTTIVTPLVNITGFWVSVAAASVICVFTQTATNGVACRSHNPTTLVLNAGASQQFDAGAVTVALPAVVCGSAQSANVTYVMYNRTPGGGGTRSVVIGTYDSVTPTTTAVKTYEGVLGSGAIQAGTLSYAIQFPPTQITSSRTIVGIAVSTYVGTATGDAMYTWFALDITNITGTAGKTDNPGILAQGPLQGTSFVPTPTSCLFSPQPGVAKPVANFRFPSLDFTSFSASGGLNPSWGLNQVTLIAPDADSMGEETVISGSVPHAISRGYCYEVGFLPLAPEFAVSAVAGIGLPVGSYTVQCCWRWVDEAGVTHRSAPSQIARTQATVAGQDIRVVVQNDVVTQRNIGDITVEVYCTNTNPTTVDPKFLVSVAPQSTVAPTTTITFSAVDTTALPLYTNSGGLQNVPIQADGGCAAVGSRMWLSDGKALYASRVYKSNGLAPSWSDEGPLTLFPPAPAGRVVSLKAMDDKLVVLCERGVYITQGDGPDDNGQGPGFLQPMQVSSMGVSNSRGAVQTDSGVVFHTLNVKTAGQGYGGLYVVTRGLQVEQISGPIQLSLTTDPLTLAYVPERDLLTASSTNIRDNFFVLDMRTKNYCTWTVPNQDIDPNLAFLGNGTVGMVGAGGLLWGLFDTGGDLGGAIGNFANVSSFQDAKISVTDSGPRDYRPRFTTNKIFANTQDGLGWSRVRSVALLGNAPASLVGDFQFVQDDTINTTVADVGVSVSPGSTTWPAARVAPEVRLTNQKCSSIQVTFISHTGNASFSALRLDVLPSRAKAPAKDRR